MAETVESPDLLYLDFIPLGDSDESQAVYATERMTIDARTEEGWEWVSDERFCAQLRNNPVQIVVEKSRLEKCSSYFRARKSFREGDSERVQVDCDVLLFIILLKFFYTGTLHIPPSEVATLLETSVFFGVDEVIDRIETWMLVTTSTTNDLELISNVVHALPAIWDTSNRYGQSTVKNFCSRFLAINFISAAAHGAFMDLPCTLLNACVNHPQLTVDSEARLFDALVRWCEAQDLAEEAQEEKKERRASFLDKVRASLIPVKILLARHSWRNFLDYKSRMIRLTSYLKSLDLSGCHEVDEDVLFHSSSQAPVPDEVVESDERTASAGVEENSSTSSGRVGSPLERILPIRSAKWPVGRPFKALTNVTVSQCNMIPQGSLVLWLGETCPNLTKLVAVNCPQIELMLLPLLSKGCPQLQTLDISLDTFSLEESEICKMLAYKEADDLSAQLHFLNSGVYPLRQLTSLALRGRSELRDKILNNILINCQALLELDLSMCTTLSDNGISEALKRLPQGLQSLRARWTKVGPSCCNVLSLSASLQTLDVESCHGLSAEGISSILGSQVSLETLLLDDTSLDDSAFLLFKGCRLRELSVKDTKVSANALGAVIRMNGGLRSLDIRGCTKVCTSGDEDNEDSTHSSAGLPYDGGLFKQLGSSNFLEELKVGWRFSYFGLEAMEPNQKLLKNFEVGVGGNLCNMCLGKISTHWSSLQKLTLCFQTIDDDGIIEILDGLRCLQVLEVEKNISYLTSRGIAALVTRCPPGLKVLKLDRFAPGMSDDDLLQLSRSCKELSHFSLVGCRYLTARSLVSISQSMRALTELRLEECGGLTGNGGACVLKSCKALERLILRHNGKGLEEDFVMKARDELLHLWYLSLDFCDSVSDSFETPEVVPLEQSLSTVLLSRCHVPESGIIGSVMSDGKAKRYHKDTIVLRWTGDRIHACTIKRRVY